LHHIFLRILLSCLEFHHFFVYFAQLFGISSFVFNNSLQYIIVFQVLTMSSRRPRIKAAPNLLAGRAKARGEVKAQPNTNNSPRSSANKPVLPAERKTAASLEKSAREQAINQNIENLSPSLESKEFNEKIAVEQISNIDKTLEKVNHVSLNENKASIEVAKSDISVVETTEIVSDSAVNDKLIAIEGSVSQETNNLITDICIENVSVVIDQVIENLDKVSEEAIDSTVTNVAISDICIEDIPIVIDNGFENLDEIHKINTTNIINTTVTIENPLNTLQVEPCQVNSDAVKLSDNDNVETDRIQENVAASTPNATVKASKLSTGQFVNGRYLPKENDTSKNKSENAKPVLKRILGAKNKFKPNLFTRSKQMEVELNRGQIQKVACLPEVNNPTRSRKCSTSEDSSRRRRHSSRGSGADSGDEKATKTAISPKSGNKVETRARKISTGDEVTTTLNNSPPSHKANSSPVSQLASKEVHESSVDSPDEMVVEEVSTTKDPPVSKSITSATAKALIQRKHVDHSSTENGKKRRRRSWSGSNSSGDELFKTKNSDRLPQKPRRKTADSKFPVADRTNYALKLRKIESKRRFSNGVPGRGTMTMFDLIYYNPDNGTEIVAEEEKGDVNSQPTSPVKQLEPVEEEADLDQDNALPVPQVKVGVNGEIIIDESSTMVETTASKRARTDLMDSTLVVENSNKMTNYGTYSKKRKYNDWGERETFRFYRALSIVGSDFSMMESLFKHRNRHELKLKFKKEERTNGALIDKCLRQRGQFSDLKQFMEEESEDEIVSEEKVDKPGRGRRRLPGTAAKVSKKGEARGRKRTSRGLYESSSGGEDADVSETSRSPAARAKHNKSSTHPKTSNQQPDTTARVQHNLQDSTTQIDTSALQKIPGVNFPAGLLAANPGLAGAKPGSLVVVASPSKTDPSSQLLHVYMVSDKKNKSLPPTREGTPPVSRSPTPTRRGGDQSGGFSIDPAVVRAVDRKRASVERGGVVSLDKARRMDEDGQIFRRQRTLSEGSTISSSRLKTLGRADQRNESFGSEPFSRTRRSRLSSLSDQPDQNFEITGNTSGITQLGTATATGTATAVALPGEVEGSVPAPQLPVARKSRPVAVTD